MIKKSSLNGPSPFSIGGRRQYTKYSGGSSPVKSPFNMGGKLDATTVTSHAMHAPYGARSGGGRRVVSKHPDAIPHINFLHMN